MTTNLTVLASLAPENSGSVSASAGSGKTWLLVSRIVRLLLNDQAARHIVAITFTRKAAGEMRQRLNERLLQFVSADDTELDGLLKTIDVTPNDANRRRARSLYDNLLRQTHSVLCTTFHAFCQSLLQSFPLEAEIAPGFTLIEDSSALQNISIDSFVNECTQTPDTVLSKALLSLIERFGSAPVCFTALKGFFNKRLDWQLYTQHQKQPAQFATEQLRQQLSLQSDDYRLSHFINPQRRQLLSDYADLLSHNTASDKEYAMQINHALTLCQSEEENHVAQGFDKISRVLLTKDKEPRKRKPSSAQSKRLGETGETRFLALHESLTTDLVQELDIQQRYKNFASNRAWYLCGQRILDLYQQLKVEQSVLDFDDLEWHTYLLLFQSEAADWVQYRLDSRIDHILVDEFQDTNHFQWRLLHALLEEMSAGIDDRLRSCFIVGDNKQSIYGFRRAEPALFSSASEWLQQAMNAANYPLSTSWRSSPIIMQMVNCVFEDGSLGLTSFPQHSTHLQQLSGSVDILPLIEKQSGDDDTMNSSAMDAYRNPLTTPRQEDSDERYYEEACRMASIIKQLTQSGHPHSGEVLNYDDIMILVRSRTHTHHYERAFREANIPYVGGGKANMFECLEIQDILALLECLVTPYKNLSLAHVLRSPIFNCSEHELQCLVDSEVSWYEKLLQTDWSENEPSLARAQKQLSNWNHYAASFPTHDALDLIYHQSDIFECYQRYAPAHLHGRIRQNLLQVMNMALEIDSGRYPSMEKFIWRLQQIKNADSEEPKDALSLENGSAIKILTIHAAKGLEAKAVFLADAGYTPKDQSTHQACVKWPVDREKPTHFVLLASKNERDQITAKLAQDEQKKSAKEQANLLYVALTRAKQYLYISAVKPTRGDDLGWYGAIKQQCERHGFATDSGDGGLQAFYSAAKKSPPVSVNHKLDAQSAPKADKPRPLPNYIQNSEQQDLSEVVLPSQFDAQTGESDRYGIGNSESIIRGNYIHRALDCLCAGYSVEQMQAQLRTEYATIEKAQHQTWTALALKNFSHPSLQSVFQHPSALNNYSELPIGYVDRESKKYVFGQADRVVVLEDSVILVDYKSVNVLNPDHATSLLPRFAPQIKAYAEGLRLIWPNKRVKSYILFTELALLLEIEHVTKG